MKLQKVQKIYNCKSWLCEQSFSFLFSVLWFAGFTVGYCCHKNVPSTSIDLPRSMLKFYDHHSHWNVSYAGISALNCFPLHIVQYLNFSFSKIFITGNFLSKSWILFFWYYLTTILLTLNISVQKLGLIIQSFQFQETTTRIPTKLYLRFHAFSCYN